MSDQLETKGQICFESDQEQPYLAPLSSFVHHGVAKELNERGTELLPDDVGEGGVLDQGSGRAAQ